MSFNNLSNNMSKINIFGKSKPEVGIKEFYSINDFFGKSTPVPFLDPELKLPANDQIKWSIWVLMRGSWLKISENNKTGATVDYTFTQKSLTRKGIRMLVEANGEKAILDIEPQKTSHAKILQVDLLDANYIKPSRPFAYGDYIIARVHCVDMELLQVKVSLWEDDGDKQKQNTTNVKIETKQGNVLNGKSDISFYLNPSHAWLANAKFAKGDKDEGKFHEYYVTAEIFEKVSKRIPSKNTNVPNPDYKTTPTTEPKKQTPAEKKGPSKKETKGIAKSENKIHDYHEQKVTVQTTVFVNPITEMINSLMKVDMDPWNHSDDKKGTCPRCETLTADEMTKVFTGASASDKNALRNAFNNANKKFGLNTCQQKAHFFAQVMQEVGISINVSEGESLNYKAQALPVHFAKFSTTGFLNGPPNDLAFKYGRLEEIKNGKTIITQNADKEMIANIAYANRNGNGNIQSGDGWKYRGRGIIQITGKDKYIKINNRIDSDYSDFSTDIDANNINNLNEGTIASMSYWKEYKCLDEANKGYKKEQLDAIVDIINKNTPTRNSRWENLKKCVEIFKVKECKNNDSVKETEGQSEYYIYKSGKIKLKKGTQKSHGYYVEKFEGKFKLLYTLEENDFGMVKIPDSGSGFNRYGGVDAGGVSGSENVGEGDHYLLPKTASALFGIINEVDEKGWEIHLGDMSSKNGSDPWGAGSFHHAGHGHNGTRKGLDCDFRYLNTSGKSFHGLNTNSIFDAEKNKTFFNIAYKYGFRKNFCANPVTVLGSAVLGVIHQRDHDDHGHIGLTDLDIEEVQSITVTKI